MIQNTIIALIVISIIIILYTIFDNYIKKLKSKMSFKESMDLTELPIITFISNDKKLNFLLDTGSNVSFINESTLKDLKYVLTDFTSNMIGVEGNKIENRICKMTICYKQYAFESEFNINNMDEAFGIIKKESGVQIHGILGSLFFQKYKYVLDFNSLIAYLK